MSKGLSKKTRFEVFKRDSFTCQYCGKAAPDVVLQCDHIHPVAKGGDDDVMNLITSCVDCNAGKSDRTLDDSSVIAKQRAQLKELNERREQLEMMLEWREHLRDFDNDVLARAADYWQQKIQPYFLTDTGLKNLRETIRKAGLQHVLDAMDQSDRFLVRDSEGKVTFESANLAFDKMRRIAIVNTAEQKSPGIRDLLYARGILRNRVSYCDDVKALSLMKSAKKAGVSAEELKELCKSVTNWTEFRQTIEEWIDQEDEGHEAENF